jgi:hypothetical protein
MFQLCLETHYHPVNVYFQFSLTALPHPQVCARVLGMQAFWLEELRTKPVLNFTLYLILKILSVPLFGEHLIVQELCTGQIYRSCKAVIWLTYETTSVTRCLAS